SGGAAAGVLPAAAVPSPQAPAAGGAPDPTAPQKTPSSCPWGPPDSGIGWPGGAPLHRRTVPVASVATSTAPRRPPLNWTATASLPPPGLTAIAPAYCPAGSGGTGSGLSR